MSEKISENPMEKTVVEAGNCDKPESAIKPNKSTLHSIVKTAKIVEEAPKNKEKDGEAVAEGNEHEKKAQKNVSTLYRIVSSQNVVLKPLKGSSEADLSDDDGIEYENIMDVPDKGSGSAENTIYFVGGGKEESNLTRSGGKSSELKKSSLEIRIVPPPPRETAIKRSQSTVETSRKITEVRLKPADGPKTRKSDPENVADLGDLSAIRFSFFDDKKAEDTQRDFLYDTIDESKSNSEITSRDHMACSEDSGTENVYSSPRTSLNSRSVSQGGDCTLSDQEASGSGEGESELFYAASEVLNLKPSIQEVKESKDYEDVELENEKLPEIPQPEVLDPEEYADVDVNDYCRHRAENPKNLNLNPKENKAMVKVRSKINKAWKSMKNWINEEREARDTREASSSLPRATTIDMIKVLREEKEVVEIESTPEASKRSVSPDCVAGRKFCSNSENVQFLDAERRDNSDCGTYVDMTRSQMSESSTELFPGFTLLRKRREGASGSPSFRKSRSCPEGQNGFEELRRYIKQGGDFCKELSVILQERSEAEAQYAKSLSKLSHKLLKTSKDAVGSVSEAWQRIGAEMEAQSEVHRNFAAALSEEVVKPLKQLLDSQHRIRKNVEGIVDKTGKTLTEWRQAECKSKKQSFLCARENEKLQDNMLDLKNIRNASNLHLHHHNHKNISDKESAKMDLKRKKAEESVKKADIEYYSFCVRAERCRLDWESAVTRGSHCFQGLEEERLACLKSLAFCYLKHFRDIGPRLVQSTDRLADPIETCDVTRDIQTVVAMKGSGQPMQEQLLPDFYAEHVTLAMNKDRRKQALVKLLQLIMQDLERERRGKEGVENLQRALQQTPNFGAEESQQNVDEKLYHMKSMLIYLEAARYKVQSALAELDGKPKQPHPLATHIHMTRDRQGLQQSVLRVPCWAKNESMGEQTGHESPDWAGRESGDGTSVQPDSDFDEFSSVGSDKDYQCSVYNVPIISDCNGVGDKGDLGQCRALYEYTAKVYDELNLRIGDIIKIHDKHPDGWWLGELDGVVGIFPATYVEEIH